MFDSEISFLKTGCVVSNLGIKWPRLNKCYKYSKAMLFLVDNIYALEQ